MSKESEQTAAAKARGRIWPRFFRFVAHPLTDWKDLQARQDSKTQDKRDTFRQLIDRKKVNDEIRQQEFALLRQLMGRKTSAQDSAAGERGPHVSRPDLTTEVPVLQPHAAAGNTTTDRVKTPDRTDASQAMAMDGSKGQASIQDNAFDTRLQEVAVAFAGGDDAGAEAALLDLLQQRDGPDKEQICLYLLDFYRASQQSGKFEEQAQRFIRDFGHPAPPWALPGNAVPEPSGLQQAQARDEVRIWRATVDLSARELRELLCSLAPDVHFIGLDFLQTRRIDEEAAQALLELFTHLSHSTIRVKIKGGSHLLDLLADDAVIYDQQVAPHLWLARMQLLQMMGQAEAFEAVALDYCVTYELAPPLWEPPRCRLEPWRDEHEDGVSADARQQTRHQILLLQQTSSTTRDGMQAADESQLVCLTGDLCGDISAQLQALETSLAASEIVLDASALRRMDFEASSHLLNWALQQKTAGKNVRLVQAHRLLIAFLHMMGFDAVMRIKAHTDQNHHEQSTG